MALGPGLRKRIPPKRRIIRKRRRLDFVEDVLRNYNNAPTAKVGTSELRPLGLTSVDLAQLVAFLKTLSAPPNAPKELLTPP